jgi:hypothetical protein
MIAAQLFLDVQEFGRKVAAQGGAALDPREMGAYRALWRAVAPEGQEDAVLL